MKLLLRIVAVAIVAWLGVRLFELVGPLTRAWTPTDFATAGGKSDRWAIAGAREDARWCRALLDASEVAYARVPDRVTAPGCGFAGAVRLTGADWSPRGPVMTCPVALAATIWQRRVVRPAAREALGTNLTTLQHYGTYSCRTVAGSSRPSQHSTANAVDIAGFGLTRGAVVSVRRDWNGPPERAAFLRRVHAGACSLYGTVLGPDYNAAHRDHLHLDMANWNYCP